MPPGAPDKLTKAGADPDLIDERLMIVSFTACAGRRFATTKSALAGTGQVRFALQG